jgi:hypothetical protein
MWGHCVHGVAGRRDALWAIVSPVNGPCPHLRLPSSQAEGIFKAPLSRVGREPKGAAAVLTDGEVGV